MAKTNIVFNNKNYSIEESSLSAATTSLKSHLLTVMNGSGATINLGGTAYGVDSAKLSAATNDFTSHLATIAGNGSKVVVGGKEYSIDSTKLTGAISELEAVFGGVGEERLDGDGAEYYTLAPTALSFRSTAPLNELQNVQINGVTVDPSNYTLEEGSTIVTFPIEYLKTLNVGTYEVAIASDSKTVKGDFTVAAPELNEHGFYYNQPYTAFVSVFGGNTAVFIRNDGTLDLIVVETGYVETCNYSIVDNQLNITAVMGAFTASFSNNGNQGFVNELATTFVLGDDSIVADKDYIYIYKEDLCGYEVKVIDNTKAEYGVIKTGINGIDTVKLTDSMFSSTSIRTIAIPDGVTTIGIAAFGDCNYLKTITIPVSVSSIGDRVFINSNNLSVINYQGTEEQWNAISFGKDWRPTGSYTIHYEADAI